ncbi:MAG: hypothetical protein P0116_08520 [Candidatus Nitrosocosmicus sp.]|nr:hypothetical protein [Candidatus Nitrosocosmicus sp.]
MVNSANQGIGQSQTSNQGSGVASGGNTAGSGNNANTQTQNNTEVTLIGTTRAVEWWQFSQPRN